MQNSVDNEHYCLHLLAAFGLPVAPSHIETFGKRRVLVVERFDRQRRGNRILRLPQEDCCQALTVPPAQKYQNTGGPSATDILKLLRRAAENGRPSRRARVGRSVTISVVAVAYNNNKLTS